MAKLTKMPPQHIVDGLKGKLDFYEWMGLTIVRSWPRSPGHDRAPRVREQWPAFAWAGSYWNDLPIDIKEIWNELARPFDMTGRDLFTKQFISGDAFVVS